MKVSKIGLVLVVALSLAAMALPAGAQCVPFGLGFGGCGFGVPFGIGTGANFVSSFQSSTSFTTAGVAGFGVPFGLGFGGCGLGFGGLGFGGFASPFGFC